MIPKMNSPLLLRPRRIKDKTSGCDGHMQSCTALHAVALGKFIFGIVFLICLGCGKHEIKNFGYTKQDIAEVAEVSVTWQDRFEEAVNQNKIEEFQSLLEEEADYTVLLKNGRTPLTHTVAAGSAFFVNLLLQKNIDVHLKDGHGKIAMDYANELDKHRVKLLLDSNLQTSLQNDFYQAILADEEDISEQVKSYLEAGVDPNFIDEQTGETPLTQAIKIKSIAVTQIIRWTDKDLEITATDINLPNAQGHKPLFIALEMKFNKVVKALEDLGALKD